MALSYPLPSRTGSSTFVVLPMTEVHIPATVEVHLEAFEDYMNVKLGRRYVRAFLLWFVGNPSSVALVSQVHGETVGYVVGAPVGYNRRLNRDLWLVGGLGLATRPYLLLEPRVRNNLCRRLRAMFSRSGPAQESIFPSLPKPTMSLVGIGLRKNCRGHGTGAALLRAFEEEARKRGMASYCLSVYRSNKQARRFYEKHGMACHEAGQEDYLYYSKVLAEVS